MERKREENSAYLLVFKELWGILGLCLEVNLFWVTTENKLCFGYFANVLLRICSQENNKQSTMWPLS
jgi:hypothetical protein